MADARDLLTEQIIKYLELSDTQLSEDGTKGDFSTTFFKKTKEVGTGLHKFFCFPGPRLGDTLTFPLSLCKPPSEARKQTAGGSAPENFEILVPLLDAQK